MNKEYLASFDGPSVAIGTKKMLALERAWKNRDFEIEHYWKRATYFWTFIAAAFAGYFLLMTKANVESVLCLAVICLGLIFSLAWALVNLGSKMWQENWEAHIDLLEDEVTGPVHKFVKQSAKHTFSVSKINEMVSWFVFGVWIFLLLWHLVTKITWSATLPFDFFSLLLVSGTVLVLTFMFYSGRTNKFTDRKAPDMVLRTYLAQEEE